MCGRYYLAPDPNLGRAINRSALASYMWDKLGKPLTTDGESYPTDIVPAFATSRLGSFTVFPMVWGFTAHTLLSNARVETAATTRIYTPKKKKVMETPAHASGSLLIDIQAKLQEGKGAGYARWATNFNLKQLSQTLIYLEENGLLDGAVLEEKTFSATAQYHTFSSKLKGAEKRMAEIKIMQQHIINYAKTRDTYVAYRKAGYSKKFLAEHESEIILHKAAKQFFDERGLKNSPPLKVCKQNTLNF